MLFLLLTCVFYIIAVNARFAEDALLEINKLSHDAAEISQGIITVIDTKEPRILFNQLFVILDSEVSVLKRIMEEWDKEGCDKGEEKYATTLKIMEDMKKLMGKNDIEKAASLMQIKDVMYSVYDLKERLKPDGLRCYFDLKGAFDQAAPMPLNTTGFGVGPNDFQP
uniref:Uncharacterized protein n=1 Tax=Clastoptera arizonana TaxID=38151 RepID=A0A1B6BW42_9HEMI